MLLPLLLSALALADPPALDALVDAALASHPAVVAARAGTDAAEAQARVAGSWSDPTLSVEYSNAPVDSFDVSQAMMGGVQFGLRQTFPTSGMPARRQAVARHDAARAEALAGEVDVALATEVRTAWWGLTRARALAALVDRHATLTRALREGLEGRYQAGTAAEHELVRWEVRALRLEEQAADLRATEQALRSRLTALTGRSGPFPTPADPPPRALDGHAEDWLLRARDGRPALAALAEEAEGADAAAALARAQGIPDLTAWIGYRLRTVQTATDPGTDFVSLGLSIPLPVSAVRRGRGDADAAEARSEVAEARAADLEARLEAELRGAEASWRRALDRRERLASLRPSAERALEVVQAAYTQGRADLTAVFEAEVQLLELATAELEATVETQLLAARVDALVGTPPRAEAGT